MPSQRRIKVLGLVVLLTVLTIIYFTSAARETRESQFYQRTSAALQEKEQLARAEQDKIDAARMGEDVGRRLKEAEEQAKKSADAKGRKMAQEVMGTGLEADSKDDDAAADGSKSVAGRLRMKDDGDEPLGVAKVGGNVGEKDRKGKSDDGETEEDHEVEVELNAILKKSPIIIFSKTYCPYSRKAKRIMLETYKITPAPYVVELDTHPLGAALQAALAKKTDRRTVPNILVNGISIGGGDDIESYHRKGKLEETLRDMGGKRIMEVLLVEDEDGAKTEVKRDSAKKVRRGS